MIIIVVNHNLKEVERYVDFRKKEDKLKYNSIAGGLLSISKSKSHKRLMSATNVNALKAY